MAWQAWGSSLRVFEWALSEGKVCERPCSGPTGTTEGRATYAIRATRVSFKDILCAV